MKLNRYRWIRIGENWKKRMLQSEIGLGVEGCERESRQRSLTVSRRWGCVTGMFLVPLTIYLFIYLYVMHIVLCLHGALCTLYIINKCSIFLVMSLELLSYVVTYIFWQRWRKIFSVITFYTYLIYFHQCIIRGYSEHLISLKYTYYDKNIL